MAGTATVMEQIVDAAKRSPEDLKPEQVTRAKQFIRQHASWLEKNNIFLITHIEEFDFIDHQFKKVVMDFGVVVEKIRGENKITKHYMEYLKNPKYQENKMVQKVFTTVFQKQLEGL